MRFYLIIAFRNLMQAKRRTMLLGFALALVTTLLVIMLSLSSGLSDTMIGNATSMQSGHVNIAGWYKNKESDAWPMVTGLEKIKDIAYKNTPDVDVIIDRSRGWAKMISETGSIFISPSGIDINEEQRLLSVLQLAPQNEYHDGGTDLILGDIQKLKDDNSIMIFASQAKRLNVDVGDVVTLTADTDNGRTNTVDATIVAIGKDRGFMSNWNAFVPKKTIRYLYQIKDDTSSVVMIYLKDPHQAEQVMGHLRQVYADQGYTIMDHDPQPFFMKFERIAGEDWTGMQLDLTIWRDEVAFITWIVAAIDALSFFLLSILAVIIAIGIMNSMWIAVRERTTEIGTIRAIGTTKNRVLLLFIFEAGLLGVLATSIGATIGSLIAALVDVAQLQVPSQAMKAIMMSDTLHLSPHLSHVVFAIISFTLITALSAFWPAYRASKLEPVIAIQRIK